MKRLLTLLLCIILSVSLLAACGGTVQNPPAEPETPPAVGDAPEANTPSEPETPAETDNSLAYIKDRGEITIGLDDTFAPMGFRDEAGNLIGFDIDFAEAVCVEMGVTPTFQPIDWDAKYFELDSGNIDCIWNGMSITPERIEILSLTRGYLNNRIILMAVPGVTINTVDDLANYQIGTQAQSAALEVAMGHEKSDLFKDNINEYRSYDDCIMDMRAGRIDVMIIDEVAGLYKNTQLESDKQFIVPPVDFGDDIYAVGLRKGDEALTTELQRAIDAVIESGAAAEISKKWFGSDIVIKP